MNYQLNPVKMVPTPETKCSITTTHFAQMPGGPVQRQMGYFVLYCFSLAKIFEAFKNKSFSKL